MTSTTRRQTHRDQIQQFVEYLVEVLEKIRAPLPDEMAQLLSQLDDLSPEDKPRHIANPTAFYRMSSFLYRNASPTMGELSHALSVPLPTATRMANWWVENGYAERLPDANDRRIVRVAQTDKGRRLHDAIESHMGQSIQRVVACLKADEQATLLDYIRKVVYALREDAG